MLKYTPDEDFEGTGSFDHVVEKPFLWATPFVVFNNMSGLTIL